MPNYREQGYIGRNPTKGIESASLTQLGSRFSHFTLGYIGRNPTKGIESLGHLCNCRIWPCSEFSVTLEEIPQRELRGEFGLKRTQAELIVRLHWKKSHKGN